MYVRVCVERGRAGRERSGSSPPLLSPPLPSPPLPSPKLKFTAVLTAMEEFTPSVGKKRRSVLPKPQKLTVPLALMIVRQFWPTTAASSRPVVVSTTPAWLTRANTRADVEDVTEAVPTGEP